MIAVGTLDRIWLDVPEEMDDMDTLAREFEKYFEARWEDVMVGGDRPFVYHKDWEAYFAVTGLKPVSGLTLSGLPPRAKRYNIIAGS